jgi:hypothetical protein
VQGYQLFSSNKSNIVLTNDKQTLAEKKLNIDTKKFKNVSRKITMFPCIVQSNCICCFVLVNQISTKVNRNVSRKITVFP